jgi:hypothetical protein
MSVEISALRDDRRVFARYLKDERTALAVVEAVRNHPKSCQYVLRTDVTHTGLTGWMVRVNYTSSVEYNFGGQQVIDALDDVVRLEHIINGYQEP